MKLTAFLLFAILLFGCVSNSSETPQQVASACANSGKIPSSEALDKMSATELFQWADSAKTAGELIIMQAALGQATDPCDRALAARESWLRELAISKSDLERLKAERTRVRLK